MLIDQIGVSVICTYFYYFNLCDKIICLYFSLLSKYIWSVVLISEGGIHFESFFFNIDFVFLDRFCYVRGSIPSNITKNKHIF